MQFSFDVGILIIFSELEMDYKDQLKRNYFMLDKGYNSFPATIWGTPYHDAIRVGLQNWSILYIVHEGAFWELDTDVYLIQLGEEKA